jgi:hypothetical protein
MVMPSFVFILEIHKSFMDAFVHREIFLFEIAKMDGAIPFGFLPISQCVCQGLAMRLVANVNGSSRIKEIHICFDHCRSMP